VKLPLPSIAFIFLSGAALNVVVAWGIALAIDPFTGGSGKIGAVWRDGEYWCVVRIGNFGTLHARSERARNLPTQDREEIPGPEDLAPPWSGFVTPRSDYASGTLDTEYRMGEARGWPQVTLWCETLTPDGYNVTDVSGGIRVRGFWYPPDRPYDSMRFPKTLPLRPIWCGAVVNTLFYAAVVLLMIRAPLVARWCLRRKLRLCPACGYNLRGGSSCGCPECGWRRRREGEAGATL
jgi:hypothetical protein